MTKRVAFVSLALTVVLLGSLLVLTSAGALKSVVWNGVGVFQNDDPRVQYSGSWQTVTESSASGGDYRASQSSAASVTFRFFGSNVQWWGPKGPDFGKVTVSVDDRVVSTVDQSASAAVGQQNLFETTKLSFEQHTLTLTAADGASDSSAGLAVDYFRVADDQPPAPVQGFSALPGTGMVVLSWQRSTGNQIEKYLIYRSESSSGSFDLLSDAPATDVSYVDGGVGASGDTYRYYIVAVDYLGRESMTHFVSEVTLDGSPAPTASDEAVCSHPTAVVDSTTGLRAALAALGPGDVLAVEAGHYTGQFKVSVTATEKRQAWVCGSSDVVFDGGDTAEGDGIHVADSTYVHLFGMTVTNSKKGVAVDRSSHIWLTGLTVRQIGEEGIHLRSNTTDSTVAGNTVSGTGLKNRGWGEGIYVGSANLNWCRYSGCEPDASSRNTIADNTISDTAAEAIDVKEGAVDGRIVSNRIDGNGSSATTRSIAIKSNGWLIADNSLVTGRDNDFIAVFRPTQSGYGKGNVISGNTARFDGSSGGFLARVDAPGNTVKCTNQLEGTSLGVTNQACAAG